MYLKVVLRATSAAVSAVKFYSTFPELLPPFGLQILGISFFVPFHLLVDVRLNKWYKTLI